MKSINHRDEHIDVRISAEGRRHAAAYYRTPEDNALLRKADRYAQREREFYAFVIAVAIVVGLVVQFVNVAAG